MGVFLVPCPVCGNGHMWFSGNLDQRCVDCKKKMQEDIIKNLLSEEIKLGR
jgi:tRNA(Ile2) C34 agmatinyltransferase TiaS